MSSSQKKALIRIVSCWLSIIYKKENLLKLIKKEAQLLEPLFL
jgi:hypothetical protein